MSYLEIRLEQSLLYKRLMRMAEGVGFEPTDPCGSPVFKTGAINRSTIPPYTGKRAYQYSIDGLKVNGKRQRLFFKDATESPA